MDQEHEDTITELHRDIFNGSAPVPDLDVGDYWILYDSTTPVGFCGLVPGRTDGTGYLIRVGILGSLRGRGLYRRLIQVRERKAKKYGWTKLVTDTIHPSVVNKLTKAGYKLYVPEQPWAFKGSYYMYKALK